MRARLKAIVASTIVLCAVSLALMAWSAETSRASLSVDRTFGTAGLTSIPGFKKPEETNAGVALRRPGGGYFIAGNTMRHDSNNGMFVAALDRAGLLIKRFGKNGRASVPRRLSGFRFEMHTADVSAMAIQNDGKVVVAAVVDAIGSADQRQFDREIGDDPDCNCGPSRPAIALIRFDRRGRLDRSFGRNGVALIRSVVARYTTNELGVVDLGDIAIDRSGRILVYATTEALTRRSEEKGEVHDVVYRLRENGARDNTFSRRGRFVAKYKSNVLAARAGSLVLRSGGRISVSSTATRLKRVDGDWKIGDYRLGVRGLTKSGATDRRFGHRGKAYLDLGGQGGVIREVVAGPNDSLYIAGARVWVDPNEELHADPFETGAIVGRLNRRGRLDASWCGKGYCEIPNPAQYPMSGVDAIAVNSSGGIFALVSGVALDPATGTELLPGDDPSIERTWITQLNHSGAIDHSPSQDFGLGVVPEKIGRAGFTAFGMFEDRSKFALVGFCKFSKRASRVAMTRVSVDTR
ncbi:MAG: hypothetical protein ACPGYP_06740 [Solirubrobacterales bacterium]